MVRNAFGKASGRKFCCSLDNNYFCADGNLNVNQGGVQIVFGGGSELHHDTLNIRVDPKIQVIVRAEEGGGEKKKKVAFSYFLG